MKHIPSIRARSFAYPFRVLTIIFMLTFSILGYASDSAPATEKSSESDNQDSDLNNRCVSVKDRAPPKSDIPSTQTTSALSGCNPTVLYYEAKGKVTADADWRTVRDCAFAEYDSDVLVMLYANGFGVSKNVNLATKFACDIADPDRMDSLIARLDLMSDEGDDTIIDLCDYANGSHMIGLCAYYEEIQNTQERNYRLAELTAHWPQSQKDAFGKLQIALKDFAALVSSEETDGSGSGRAYFMIEAGAAEMELFVTDIVSFEKGDTPRFTPKQLSEYDKTLNQQYKEIMRSKPMTEWPTRLGYTTITKEGVRNTQRAWLKYRDAWVAFGHLKYPSVSPQSWKALLTERRIKTLEHLLDVAKNGV